MIKPIVFIQGSDNTCIIYVMHRAIMYEYNPQGDIHVLGRCIIAIHLSGTPISSYTLIRLVST